MKRSARVSSAVAAAAGPAGHRGDAGEEAAQRQDVLLLRLSRAALDLQGALGVLSGGEPGRVEGIIGEMDQILGGLRQVTRLASALSPAKPADGQAPATRLKVSDLTG